MEDYKTRTGKPGVICVCGRKVLLTPSGILYWHSPVRYAERGGWCSFGGKART